MEIRDPNTGQIKTWVWGVAALGFVIFLFVISKMVSGGQTTAGGTIPASGQSSDISDLLRELNESLADMNPDPTQPTGPAPPVPPTPNPTNYKQYTVLQGDTWKSIAGKFSMTLEQFFTKNPALKTIGTPDSIRSGGRNVFVFDVAAKTATPTTFTVAGPLANTWNEIASKFNLTLTQFFALNPTLDTRREKRADRERRVGREVVVGTSYT